MKDTITDIDSFFTTLYEVDTAFSWDEFFKRDTVIIENEKVRVEFRTREKHDSVFVYVKIPADTIIQTETIPVDKIVPCPEYKYKWWEKVVAALAVIGLFGVLVFVIRRLLS